MGQREPRCDSARVTPDAREGAIQPFPKRPSSPRPLSKAAELLDRALGWQEGAPCREEDHAAPHRLPRALVPGGVHDVEQVVAHSLEALLRILCTLDVGCMLVMMIMMMGMMMMMMMICITIPPPRHHTTHTLILH